MPILLIVLIAILVAQVGFWDTLGALLGAAAVLALFWVILLATVALRGAPLRARRYCAATASSSLNCSLASSA
jgi:hypothetical protein